MVPPVHSDPGQTPGLDSAELLTACPQLINARRLIIGFSGGLDSTVLLHMIAVLRDRKRIHVPVTALHINHGLQRSADDWQQHCADICGQLSIPLLVRNVTVDFTGKESPEEAARSARYAAFADIVEEGEMILLAHHQDDQVETVLFRLIRGSGTKGLAGIPEQRSCGSGSILRPLLGFRRFQVLHYALQHQLTWIEDGSNLDERYDRNFLRASVVPQLEQRFPGIAGNIIRSAALCAEGDELAGELAALDLTTCIGTFRNRLHIPSLLNFSEARQRNLLRFWIAGLQVEMECGAPGHIELHRIVHEVIPAAPDAEPSVFWGRDSQRVGIRRFRNQLYLLKPLPASPEELVWDTATSLELPFPLGKLELLLKNDLTGPPEQLQQLRVCFRKGGELVKQPNRPARPMKKILQESAIPPWLRNDVPLIYCGPELLAIADLLNCSTSLQNISATDFNIRWVRPELHCGY
jgi:tRNA(Ile)-lysidine synthase